MRNNIKIYHKNFLNLINSIECIDGRKKKIDFYHGIEIACAIIKKRANQGGKVLFIGNGGSAAIANHMTVDFWKNGLIPAMSFNDSSLLTCISNDFSYKDVFAIPIKFFATKNDILFAISSSGRSKNILTGAAAMAKKGGVIISLSGFDENNPLSSRGICNFYVPSHEYGLVESCHQYICHFILDTLINSKLAKKGKQNYE